MAKYRPDATVGSNQTDSYGADTRYECVNEAVVDDSSYIRS